VIECGHKRWSQTKGFWHRSGERIDPKDWASVRALTKGEISLNELIDIETYDGQRKIMRKSAAPVRNAEGVIVGAVIVNEDVSDRVRAEEALRRSGDELRLVIDTIPQQIWSGPPDGTNDYVNARWRSETGLSIDDVRGDGWQTLLHPEDRDRVLKAWNYSVLTGTPYEQEERHC